MQGRERGNFVVLDRLRGVAALLVLIDHAGSLLFGFDPVPRNHLAVHFFFMLSGFVIACSYDQSLRTSLSAIAFLRLRAIRLYPLVTVGSLLGALSLWVSDPRFAADPMALPAVAMSALSLPIGTPGFGFGHFPVNPPEWSLFFELMMNFGFALIAPRLSLRHITVLALLGSASHAMLRVVAWPHPMPFAAEALGALGAFAAGVALWRWRDRHGDMRHPGHQAVLIGALVAICMVPLQAGWLFEPLVTMLAFPLLILAGAAHGRTAGVTSRLGAVSYPLYILHWPVLIVAQAWLVPILGAAGAAGLACIIALSLAWLALNRLDAPLRRWLSAPWQRDRVAIATGQPRHQPAL